MGAITHPWLYRGRHLVSARDFDRASLEMIFHTTKVIKAAYLQEAFEPYASCLTNHDGRPLRFRLLFWGNSTRTEGSFEDAIEALGGTCITKQMQFSSAAKGESHWSITRILGPRCHGIIARDDSEEGRVAIPLMADAIEAYGLPSMLINAGNGMHEHPTQMALDTYSVWEERRSAFESGLLTFGLVGDLPGSRTIHSFIIGVRNFGGKIVLVGPDGWDIPQEYYALVAGYPRLSIMRVSDMYPVLEKIDVWYFTRVQNNLRGEREKLTPERERWYAVTYGMHGPFRMRIKKDALVLHPLPHGQEYPDEHRGESIDLVDPRFIHFKQADNGFYVRMALLALMHVPDFYNTHICAYANGVA